MVEADNSAAAAATAPAEESKDQKPKVSDQIVYGFLLTLSLFADYSRPKS